MCACVCACVCVESAMNALAAEQALLHSRSDGIADAWRASWLSRLTWSYMTPLLRLGYKRALEMDDVGR
ncbi:hypothetical protein EON67_00200 [archaeon]|nr:MAG: hypothetical protein EON67_00200 [archaeon]